MSGPHGAGPGDGHADLHRYESSGIEERTGRVPAWLVAVIVVLFVWMVYYLVRNWSPPA